MVLVLVVYGNKFSTVEEEGVTTQVLGFNPEICALSGLIFAGPSAWHASTMLNPVLPAAFPAVAIDMSAGIMFTVTSPCEERKPSKLANQKNLSLRIGPPAVAPNCSSVAGVTAPLK